MSALNQNPLLLTGPHFGEHVRWDDAGDYLFDTRIEYDVLGELLGVARSKGDASLAASLSQQRSRLRKEMQQYERLQSSGLEDPGLSNTLAAALSDLNGGTAPK